MSDITIINREIGSTKLRVIITKDLGIELDVSPGSENAQVGRSFLTKCENKHLCEQSNAGLNNPKILEAMLKHSPVTVVFDGFSTATVKYESSFYGVDTSLTLVAIKLRKQKIDHLSTLLMM